MWDVKKVYRFDPKETDISQLINIGSPWKPTARYMLMTMHVGTLSHFSFDFMQSEVRELYWDEETPEGTTKFMEFLNREKKLLNVAIYPEMGKNDDLYMNLIALESGDLRGDAEKRMLSHITHAIFHKGYPALKKSVSGHWMPKEKHGNPMSEFFPKWHAHIIKFWDNWDQIVVERNTVECK